MPGNTGTEKHLQHGSVVFRLNQVFLFIPRFYLNILYYAVIKMDRKLLKFVVISVNQNLHTNDMLYFIYLVFFLIRSSAMFKIQTLYVSIKNKQEVLEKNGTIRKLILKIMFCNIIFLVGCISEIYCKETL